MSFDQDPTEQANISGADFAVMCEEMKQHKERIKHLERQVVSLKQALGIIADDLPRLMHNQDGREMFCYYQNPSKQAREALAWADQGR